MLRMPVVVDERCRLHDPGAEIWLGVRTPGTEVAARLEAILAALDGARVVQAERHDDEALLAVHDAELVEYLHGAWQSWEAAGYPADPGQDRVVPYLFPHPRLGLVEPHVPAATSALAGWFAYDTMTLVGPGTWDAARGAVDAALTAVDLVLAGEPFAYACCRPPGHHACRACFGGSCYLNNAAAATAALRATGRRVGVLDVDAHHGNGTQEIFWDAADVVVASVHVDPGAGWFPHFVGFADETGARGSNHNVLVPPGAGDDAWLAAVVEACARLDVVDALVVSLGVDAAAGDPESPLQVTSDGFAGAGAAIGSLGVPTVLVQEGGYDLESLGPLVRTLLVAAEGGRTRL